MNNEMAQLPKTLQQWVPVILMAIFVLIVFVSGMAVAQHQADEQFIGNDELKQSVQELESYSSEASTLARYTLNESSPKPYTSAYASSLQEAVDSLSEKLMEHPHAKPLDDKVSRVIEIADDLSSELGALSTQPHNQLPSDLSDTLDNVSESLQSLEQQL